MSVTHRFIAGVSAATVVAACLSYMFQTSARAGDERVPGASSERAAPVFGIKIQRGYRDWRVVSVAHEAGKLNDIRAILGNDRAIEAFRAGSASFPDGAIISRLAWSYVASEENNKVFGHEQSFVAGAAPEWYLQFMVKDSKKYATTGGWGFAQFDKEGTPAPEAPHLACFPCHQAVAKRDFVFTRYAP